MNTFRTNFGLFVFFFALLTLLFRWGLDTALAAGGYGLAWGIAIGYGLLSFMLGRTLGIRSAADIPLAGSGYFFHCATYVVFGLVSYLWFQYGSPLAGYDVARQLEILQYTLLFWGIGLLIHSYFFFKHYGMSIKGISKGDIFE